MTFRQFAQRIRVPAGFVLAPLLFISARPTSATLAAGAFVALIGLAIRGWASGHLKKMEELTTSGPYAHTRNPLYLGTFLLGVGVAVGGATLWFIVLFAAFYLMIYVLVMLAEAETMRSLFAQDYERYSKECRYSRRASRRIARAIDRGIVASSTSDFICSIVSIERRLGF